PSPLRRLSPGAWLTRSARSIRQRLRPSESPTRSLAHPFDGALPPSLKLRRDHAEARRAKAGRSRGSLRSARSRLHGPSPLGLPYTRPPSPLRRLSSAFAKAMARPRRSAAREGGPFAWLASHRSLSIAR